jgi:hypothetical protein
MVELPYGDDVIADFLEGSDQLDAAMVIRGMTPVVYLWRLLQDENTNYDTYDSCVVAAETEVAAKLITPSNVGASHVKYDDVRRLWVDEDGEPYAYSGWATSPDNVTAECVGVAIDQPAGTVVCASYNAG